MYVLNTKGYYRIDFNCSSGWNCLTILLISSRMAEIIMIKGKETEFK